MATELSTIVSNLKAAITTGLAAEGIVLSTSQVAEWDLWCNSVGQAIHDFEVVQDALQSDVENYVNTKQPASKLFYAQQAFAWQFGDNVLVNATGQIYYANVDASKQIIKQCSIDEVTESGVTTLLIKVAKDDGSGTLIPLSSEELLEFTAYIEQIKWAGTYIVIVSQNADTIKYAYDVEYSGLYSAIQMLAALAAAADAFKYAQRFDALFYQSKFAEYLGAVPGVIAVNKTTLQGKQDGGSYGDIALSYQLQSGYFNWDGTSSFNLIAG